MRLRVGRMNGDQADKRSMAVQETIKIGQVLRIILPGDIARRGKILDMDDGMILVRWVEYDLPDEWIRRSAL